MISSSKTLRAVMLCCASAWCCVRLCPWTKCAPLGAVRDVDHSYQLLPLRAVDWWRGRCPGFELRWPAADRRFLAAPAPRGHHAVAGGFLRPDGAGHTPKGWRSIAGCSERNESFPGDASARCSCWPPAGADGSYFGPARNATAKVGQAIAFCGLSLPAEDRRQKPIALSYCGVFLRANALHFAHRCSVAPWWQLCSAVLPLRSQRLHGSVTIVTGFPRRSKPRARARSRLRHHPVNHKGSAPSRSSSGRW